MENNKSFEFKDDDILEMELLLVKAITTFHESPDPSKTKNYVQEYILRYCCERKFPVKDTIDKLNTLLRSGIKVNIQDVVPESKRGQEHIIRGDLAAMLIKSGAIWDETKTNEMMSTFCEVTGVSKDMAAPIIATVVKQKKRAVIENELYDFLGKHVSKMEDSKTRKAASEEVINAFSEQLKVEPKYIRGVLKDKKKKDEAERKRIEEYRANKAKKNVNLDDDSDSGR